jgi:hypothetical protein
MIQGKNKLLVAAALVAAALVAAALEVVPLAAGAQAKAAWTPSRAT